MTREEAKKLIGENATEEQVTNILNVFHSKENEIKDLNTKLTNSSNRITELEGFETQIKEINDAKMTEEERLKNKEQELNQKISDTKKLSNSIKAKSILIGAGISSERAEKLANQFVKEDEQSTIDLANEIVNELATLREVTTKKIKEEYSNVDLRPNGGNSENSVMTWEKFTKMNAEEQTKFAQEHPNEFNAL